MTFRFADFAPEARIAIPVTRSAAPLRCRWVLDPASGRPEMRWTRGVEPGGLAPDGASAPPMHTDPLSDLLRRHRTLRAA